MRIVILLCACFYSISTFALNVGQCGPEAAGTASTTGNFGNLVISDPSKNVSGHVETDIGQWDTGSVVTLYCNCPYAGYKDNRYFSSKVPLSTGTISDGIQYYKINEHLEVAFKVWIAGGAQRYTYAPFDHYSNEVEDTSCGGSGSQKITDVGTGNKGSFDLKITKPFVGKLDIGSIKVLDMYVARTSDVTSVTPYLSVYLSGSIDIPPNCILNSDTNIAIDLGNTLSSDFKSVGTMPEGYTPKNFNVPITCNAAAATATLSLHVVATPATGFTDAISTDNENIGVVITSDTGTAIPPSSDEGINFLLNADYSANLSLSAYPVKLSASSISDGNYSALASLVIRYY